MRADAYFDQRRDTDPHFRALQSKPRPHVTLAENVNRLRNARGLTQEELAAAAGMRQPRIAEIERGDANPELRTLARLAEALRVEPWQLLAPHESAEPEAMGEPEPAIEAVAKNRV